jgi:hypothetical protein
MPFITTSEGTAIYYTDQGEGRPRLVPDDQQLWYETPRALGHTAYGGAEIGEVGHAGFPTSQTTSTLTLWGCGAVCSTRRSTR